MTTADAPGIRAHLSRKSGISLLSLGDSESLVREQAICLLATLQGRALAAGRDPHPATVAHRAPAAATRGRARVLTGPPGDFILFFVRLLEHMP